MAWGPQLLWKAEKVGAEISLKVDAASLYVLNPSEMFVVEMMKLLKCALH